MKLRKLLCLPFAVWAVGAAAEENFAGVPDPRLEGAWALRHVDDVRAPVFRRSGKPFVIRFADGEVSGPLACNGFFGPYRTHGDRLETYLMETTLGCMSDPWDYVPMTAVKAGRFEIEPGGRTLRFHEVGGRTFVFRKLSKQPD